MTASDAAKTNVIARPTMLAASAYTDPRVLTREREEIFAREWAYVAAASQLASSGDYVAADLAGYPVIVVNDDGALRAFHNVCKHRGGPLLWDGEGSCSSFVCRYHGWTYGLDGGLRTARDFGGDSAATDGIALAGVNVEAWRGLVFVNLDASARPLVDWIGGLAAECANFAMESFVLGHRSSHAIAANWKVYAENYQEGYHIPLVHPGLNKQIDAREYKVEVRDGYAVHSAPTRDGSVTSGAWLWRFPGFALNLYPEGMCVETYSPSSAGETRVDYAFFFAADTPADEVESTIASSDAILEEDRIICEAVQRNYESGLYEGGLFSPRHEAGVAYVQEQVLLALGGGEIDV